MRLTTTFKKLKDAGACTEGYRKLGRAMGGIKKYGYSTPINLLSILESNGVDDCLWALRATVEECEEVCRLMAFDFAEEVLPFFEKNHPSDSRPRKAIEVARRFARGEATEEERDAARAAAWAAARAAARDAARDAARNRQAEIIRSYLEG